MSDGIDPGRIETPNDLLLNQCGSNALPQTQAVVIFAAHSRLPQVRYEPQRAIRMPALIWREFADHPWIHCTKINHSGRSNTKSSGEQSFLVSFAIVWFVERVFRAASMQYSSKNSRGFESYSCVRNR